jgi:hypothetical protein
LRCRGSWCAQSNRRDDRATSCTVAVKAFGVGREEEEKEEEEEEEAGTEKGRGV